ncbi:MAG TPA: Imm1 family immunity protein [Pseudonocardiaceae bacterium]|nr:Imm1 family immunity protein [Pseudonocardiaceae bacterium]
MAQRYQQSERPILTASLTSGVARVAHGIRECTAMIDDVLALDHVDWETILLVGDVEFHQTVNGPYPDHQMRVSVQPSTGYAALSYTDPADPIMSIANSYNPVRPLPSVYLLFNGELGSVFPRTALIPVANARSALNEWLRTRKRPTCIEWRPYDFY